MGGTSVGPGASYKRRMTIHQAPGEKPLEPTGVEGGQMTLKVLLSL